MLLVITIVGIILFYTSFQDFGMYLKKSLYLFVNAFVFCEQLLVINTFISILETFDSSLPLQKKKKKNPNFNFFHIVQLLFTIYKGRSYVCRIKNLIYFNFCYFNF